MSEFGIEMRRRRMRRELSLAALADRVHYDKGYLSKIETGRLPANRRLASLVDVELEAEGELVALVPQESRRRSSPETPTADDAEGGEPDWGRELAAFGEALSVPLTMRPTAGWGEADDLRLLTHYWEEFDRHRRLSQQLPPELVLRRLIVDFNTLMELVQTSRSTTSRLRLLAARYAEFIGWMCQEAGRLDLALAWTRRTANLATRAEAADLAAYTLVREAELALYEGDPATAMELAAQVLEDPRAQARSRGLAAHRQAQAFAVRGDHAACLNSLDHARDLLHPERIAQGAQSAGEPVVGSATVGGLDNAIAGWCHYDLGRPRRASEFLADALERTPAEAHRSRALFGARLALAYEASGELEEMRAVTLQVLRDAGLVHSAGADAELRGLSRALMRHHNIKALRELRSSLDEALVGVR
ncbi:helix-turn-helix domain-containing protein [Catenulispora sp. NF23]|uniref:Helix-turn-helix domain-containing protein n=1 Tax=Catenulispora pinistramenti TaxID=2705254 RepID=A0ABS5KX65_9ACTN|nr:helix-turn-helix domain-containing protein [Catenulispora pinistramenti]MBS2534031.1 helix-turn-helix domain-containing protein [Catenulispora pinistramenti]MBS2550657.1 helix-turn-helix domain-containing protein [Catenulispora pinistramenti]